MKVTPISGIRYYYPPDDAVLIARDGALRLPYGDLPVPLLEEDYGTLEGEPTYDAVGRGIYQALRANPDCLFSQRYAHLLKDAYPHYLAELSSHIIMLDQKDVEVPYLDRKINCLKILALIEPDNAGIPLQIGMTYLDRGMRMSALQLSTVSIYKAQDFLLRAAELLPGDVDIQNTLGEVCYLLGKYEDASRYWHDIVPLLDGAKAEKIGDILQKIEQGTLPRVPAVDYLEAVGVAFNCFQHGNYEESAAILHDVLEDPVFGEGFPIPEIHCTIGRCYEALGMPKYAEESFREALKIDPGHEDARAGLQKLYE